MVSKPEKLDKMIENLETQVESINQFKGVLERIEELSSRVERLGSDLAEHAKEYVTVTNRLDQGIASLGTFA